MKNISLKVLTIFTMIVSIPVGIFAQDSEAPVGIYYSTMDSFNKPILHEEESVFKGFDPGNYFLFFSASSASANGSALDYTYGDGGCVYQKNHINNGDLDINLQLPDGHIIYGLRYYFNDTSTLSSNVLLLKFNGQGGSTTLQNLSSTGDTGFGSIYQGILDGAHVVDNSNGSYVIRFNSHEDGISQKMCAVRLFLGAPYS